MKRLFSLIVSMVVAGIILSCSKGLPVVKAGGHKYVNITTNGIRRDPETTSYIPLELYNFYNKLFIAQAKIINGNRKQEYVDAYNKLSAQFNEFISFETNRLEEQIKNDLSDEANKKTAQSISTLNNNLSDILGFINSCRDGDFESYINNNANGSFDLGDGYASFEVMQKLIRVTENSFPDAQFQVFHKLAYLLETENSFED
jgi:hypothetical protein